MDKKSKNNINLLELKLPIVPVLRPSDYTFVRPLSVLNSMGSGHTAPLQVHLAQPTSYAPMFFYSQAISS